MMKKIIIALFLFCALTWNVLAKPLDIITREEWWADESFTDVESIHWQKIISDREEAAKRSSSQVEQSSYAKNRAENKKRVEYVNLYYSERFWVSETQSYNEELKLAWPVKKSKKVDGIILHHTASEYASSLDGIREIHKYHSLSRRWWDIGYNYVIGYNGEVYEWRLWWDYAVWAHVLWNNYSTMGISVMGNYNERKLTNNQYRALKALISKIIYTYDIDMEEEIPLHKTCTDCEYWLSTKEFSPIAGHRDGWHTSCPWENIYLHIETFNRYFEKEKKELLSKLNEIKNVLVKVESTKLKKVSEKLLQIDSDQLSAKNIYILENLQESINFELSQRLKSSL